MSLDVHDDGLRGPEDGPEAGARPYVCILFECCNVYARLYRRPDEMVYRGRCPKCLRMIRIRVAPDGTRDRFFRAR